MDYMDPDVLDVLKKADKLNISLSLSIITQMQSISLYQ